MPERCSMVLVVLTSTTIPTACGQAREEQQCRATACHQRGALTM